MEAVYFGDTEKLKNYMEEKFTKAKVDLLFQGLGTENISMSFVYYTEINEFNGKKTLQIIIKNYR